MSAFLLSFTYTIQHTTTTKSAVITTKIVSSNTSLITMSRVTSKSSTNEEIRTELLKKFSHRSVECIVEKIEHLEDKEISEVFYEILNTSCELEFTLERIKSLGDLQKFYNKILQRLMKVYPNNFELVECIMDDLFESNLHEKYSFMGWKTMSLKAIMKAAKIYIEVSKINCESGGNELKIHKNENLLSYKIEKSFL